MKLIANHRIDRTELNGKERVAKSYFKGDEFECTDKKEAERLIEIGAARKPSEKKAAESDGSDEDPTKKTNSGKKDA